MTMTTTKTKTTLNKTIETLPTNPFVFEILELASKQRSNAKKVEVLQTYAHDSIKIILVWNFDDSIISLLPAGDVPYAETNEQIWQVQYNDGDVSDYNIQELRAILVE